MWRQPGNGKNPIIEPVIPNLFRNLSKRDKKGVDAAGGQFVILLNPICDLYKNKKGTNYTLAICAFFDSFNQPALASLRECSNECLYNRGFRPEEHIPDLHQTDPTVEQPHPGSDSFEYGWSGFHHLNTGQNHSTS